MHSVMYNCFLSKKSFFSIFFALIFFNVSSQNLNKKINDNPKFLKLIELSKNAIMSTLSQIIFQFKFTAEHITKMILL